VPVVINEMEVQSGAEADRGAPAAPAPEPAAAAATAPAFPADALLRSQRSLRQRQTRLFAD
jgi:hypothetical protein